MERPLLKATVVLALVAAICFAVFVAVSINPYLYTKVYGDAGTERLYQFYRLSQKGVQVGQLMKIAEANQIVVIDHEKDSMFSAHNDSETNSEEIHVWYSDGRVTNAVFTVNNP